MSGTFLPKAGDIYTSAADQIAATQTSHVNLDQTLTVTKDANAGSVTPFITSVTINSVALNQTVTITYGSTSETVIATTYDATVATGLGTIDITGILLGTDGTHALVGSSSLPAGGLILSADAQAFGSGLSDTFTPAFTLACFAAGTLIDTPDGPVPVERLRAGGAILSAFGGSVEVQWLGHRRIDCRRHPRPHDVWPVRIAAGAFGPDLPRRDLLLSPDHAVFHHGALIPVRYLLNGATIRQVPVDEITYWHVEAPAHDVLFAEGLPAESYLDTGNRAAFANGGTVAIAHPDFAREVWHSQGCAPLVTGGTMLAAARATLLAIAQAHGHRLTSDPALRVLADGRDLAPRQDGDALVWDLPAGTTAIRLRSRAAVPAHTLPGSSDHRQLGCAIARIRLNGRDLPAAARRDGWHAPETAAAAAWQWTDGDAGLDAGPGRLEITLAMTSRYWRDEPVRGRAA